MFLKYPYKDQTELPCVGNDLFASKTYSTSTKISTEVYGLIENDLYHLDNYSKAVEYYNKILSIDPKNVNALAKGIVQRIACMRRT